MSDQPSVGDQRCRYCGHDRDDHYRPGMDLPATCGKCSDGMVGTRAHAFQPMEADDDR